MFHFKQISTTMELLIKILAQLFDFFKAKNPAQALVIQSVLGTILFNLNAIVAFFNVSNPTVLLIAQFLTGLAMALTGSRTTQYIEPKDDTQASNTETNQ